MLKRTKIISVIMVIAVFIATGAMLGTLVAQKAGKAMGVRQILPHH